MRGTRRVTSGRYDIRGGGWGGDIYGTFYEILTLVDLCL